MRGLKDNEAYLSPTKSSAEKWSKYARAIKNSPLNSEMFRKEMCKQSIYQKGDGGNTSLANGMSVFRESRRSDRADRDDR